MRIRRPKRQSSHQWDRQTQAWEWVVRLGPHHAPTGGKDDTASYENALVTLEEERSRIAVMRITLEHGGEVLVYLDAYENPLRYVLHKGVDEAMLQAQTEYGVSPDEWEEVHERMPWKDRHARRSRRSR